MCTCVVFGLSIPPGLLFQRTTTATTTITTTPLDPKATKTPPELKKNNATTKVLEWLIDGDGEWDALVVERDTPVMDGFQIASALRDFEKARRNRASTVRAAAVEDHAKVAGRATTSELSMEQRDTGKACKRTACSQRCGDGFGVPQTPVVPIRYILGMRGGCGGLRGYFSDIERTEH